MYKVGLRNMPQQQSIEYFPLALPAPVKRKFKARCAKQGKTMTEVLQSLVDKWLAENR